MAVVYEAQNTNTSWYSNPIPGGTAKNNYDRIIQLRKAFCHKLTINRDGTLNKKYFSMQTKETAMNWNDIELLQLYEGIYKYGVDNVEKWIKIQSEFLPRRDFIEVRLKLSQLFGIQDLSIYKDKTFKSEKEIHDQFIKNKQIAQGASTWDDKCEIALKPELAKLSKKDMENLEDEELEHWNKNVYNNPLYVYRIHNQYSKSGKGKGKGRKKGKSNNKNNKNDTEKGKSKGKNKNKNKKKEIKVQKNTIDKMFKKENENKNDNKKKVRFEDEQKASEKTDNNNNNNNNNECEEDIDMIDKEVKIVEKKVKKKKGKKVSKRKVKKGVPLLPEDSDDEDMLCVE